MPPPSLGAGAYDAGMAGYGGGSRATAGPGPGAANGPLGALMPRFSFQPRRERVDWRNLASLNVERIMRDGDIETLQQSLHNVAFCDLEAEDLRGVDPNVSKLFRLSQLMLEYVLFTQEHLAQARQAAEAKLQEAVQINKEFADKYEHLRQENRKRKHLIASYNRMVDNTATGGPSTCVYCGKSFVTPSFLLSHMERRHPENRPFDLPVPAPEEDPAETKIKALRDQVEQLRDELTKALANRADETNVNMNQRLKDLEEAQRAKIRRLEEDAEEERKKHKRELEEIRSNFTRDLQEERERTKEQLAFRRAATAGEGDDLNRSIDRSPAMLSVVTSQSQLDKQQRRMDRKYAKLEQELEAARSKISELEHRPPPQAVSSPTDHDGTRHSRDLERKLEEERRLREREKQKREEDQRKLEEAEAERRRLERRLREQDEAQVRTRERQTEDLEREREREHKEREREREQREREQERDREEREKEREKEHRSDQKRREHERRERREREAKEKERERELQREREADEAAARRAGAVPSIVVDSEQPGLEREDLEPRALLPPPSKATHPIPSREYVKSRYPHSSSQIHRERNRALVLFKERLTHFGVEMDAKAMSDSSLKISRGLLQQAAEKRALQRRSFWRDREDVTQELEDLVKYEYKPPAYVEPEIKESRLGESRSQLPASFKLELPPPPSPSAKRRGAGGDDDRPRSARSPNEPRVSRSERERGRRRERDDDRHRERDRDREERDREDREREREKERERERERERRDREREREREREDRAEAEHRRERGGDRKRRYSDDYSDEYDDDDRSLHSEGSLLSDDDYSDDDYSDREPAPAPAAAAPAARAAETAAAAAAPARRRGTQPTSPSRKKQGSDDDSIWDSDAESFDESSLGSVSGPSEAISIHDDDQGTGPRSGHRPKGGVSAFGQGANPMAGQDVASLRASLKRTSHTSHHDSDGGSLLRSDDDMLVSEDSSRGATGKADEDEDDVDNLLASMRSNSPDKRRGGAAGASGAARLEVEDF